MRELFWESTNKARFVQGLIVGLAWPALIFLGGFFLSLGTSEATEIVHHLQNARSTFTLVVMGALFLGTGMGMFMFFTVEDEQTFFRFLGYLVPAIPIVMLTLYSGGVDYYEPPREEVDSVFSIEIDASKAIDWWKNRDKDD